MLPDSLTLEVVTPERSLIAEAGVVEVLSDRVIVLAETAERVEEIDVERARAARERAEKHLANPDPDMDWDSARFALERALLRLQVAARGGVVAPAGGEHQFAP